MLVKNMLLREQTVPIRMLSGDKLKSIPDWKRGPEERDYYCDLARHYALITEDNNDKITTRHMPFWASRKVGVTEGDCADVR